METSFWKQSCEYAKRVFLTVAGLSYQISTSPSLMYNRNARILHEQKQRPRERSKLSGTCRGRTCLLDDHNDGRGDDDHDHDDFGGGTGKGQHHPQRGGTHVSPKPKP